MNYSLEKIETVQACDALLATAQTEKVNLECRRRNLGEAIVNFDVRTNDVEDDLLPLQTRLDAFTLAHDSLHEGSTERMNMDIEIKQLQARKAMLSKSAVSYNIHALLAKQVDYNLLDSQVPSIDAYIAAVQNKRAELGGA